MLGIESFKSGLKQWGVLGLCAIGCGFGMYLIFFTTGKVVDNDDEYKPIETKIENAESTLPLTTIWKKNVEYDNKVMQDKINNLAESHQAQVKNLQALYSKKIDELQKENEAQLARMESLNRQVIDKITDMERKQLNDIQTSANKPRVVETGADYRPVYDNEEELTTVTFNLARDVLNTPENTIPANSFVKGVLLSGVDASTAVGAPKNPRPVIMEITDTASLPNGFGANVKGCRINGGATGDISSERVLIKLDKLTCIDKVTRKITVSEARGYVAGEDGKHGLRATLVIRDRALMMNSLIGGVLSGASRAVSQLASPASTFNPLTGDVNRNHSHMDLLKQAGGEGGANALDRYAKYYIDQAERLSPVLQVSSNRKIDIVFIQSTHFSEVKSINRNTNSNLVVSKPMQVSFQDKSMKENLDDGTNFANEMLPEKM